LGTGTTTLQADFLLTELQLMLEQDMQDTIGVELLRLHNEDMPLAGSYQELDLELLDIVITRCDIRIIMSLAPGSTIEATGWRLS
jgi:hypothetical protein